MIFDLEANILCMEITEGEINHTKEIGNFIFHLSPSNKPILLEILDASKFIGQIDKLNLKSLKNIEEIAPIS